MTAPKVKHVFPGGNTPQGFFSYYDYIIPSDCNHKFVLKGGPGTGKSTFMKKLGEAMLQKGYDIEFHHCSSDNNSLDGLVIPDMGIAFVDGTAPHIVDPKNPGCVDEILHLGDYWNETKMMRSKFNVIACNEQIRDSFQRGYRLLQAAKSLYDDWEAVNMSCMDYAKANLFAHAVISNIFSGVNLIGAGAIRKMFASAITPSGPVHFLGSIVGVMQHRYLVTGDPGTGKSTLIQKVCDMAISRGLSVEAYYCPLDPLKIEHLVIPALDVAVTTSVEPHMTSIVGADQVINMNECLDYQNLADYRDAITYDKLQFAELFNRAVASIRHAKSLHDQLETYYVPSMDFAGIQRLWDKTFSRVLTYAERVAPSTDN